MRKQDVILTALVALGGCSAMADSFNEAFLDMPNPAHRAEREAKARVLQPGTPAEEVRRVWGEPYDRTAHGSAAGLTEIWQYYRCSNAAFVKTTILFVTIVNGQVASWTTLAC